MRGARLDHMIACWWCRHLVNPVIYRFAKSRVDKHEVICPKCGKGMKVASPEMQTFE